MAKLNSYKHKPRAVVAKTYPYSGGLSKAGTLVPMTVPPTGGYWSKPRELIDNVTLAVELGLLNTKLWPAQLFRDPASFSVFIAFLAHEPRVNDRQHAALAKLAGATISDQSCMAPRDIANKLKARAREIGQLLE